MTTNRCDPGKYRTESAHCLRGCTPRRGKDRRNNPTRNSRPRSCSSPANRMRSHIEHIGNPIPFRLWVDAAE